MLYRPVAKSSQRAPGEKMSVLFSQPGELSILSQPGEVVINFSHEGRFRLTNTEQKGRKKKGRDRPHTAEDERKVPRKSRNDSSLIKLF